MGTDLSAHFFPETAERLENSMDDCRSQMSKRADPFKEKGEKMGREKWAPHSQNSSYSQGRMSRGCGVKVPNVIPIPDLLRQTLGRLVLLTLCVEGHGRAA